MDRLRSQTPILHTNREALKTNVSQHSIFERAREKKAQKRSIKRDASLSDAIKAFTFNQPTTDSTVVFKTCYRQTDTQTDRQKLSLPFDRPYAFSRGNILASPFSESYHLFALYNGFGFSRKRYGSEYRMKEKATDVYSIFLASSFLFCSDLSIASCLPSWKCFSCSGFLLLSHMSYIRKQLKILLIIMWT